MRLQRQNTNHGFVVVPYVSTHTRAETDGYPPQPEQTENMVDADATGVTQSGAHHVAERPICQIGEDVGTHRRLSPLLSSLIKSIRRRPDADTVSKELPEHPRIGSGTGNTHGHIAHKSQRHPGVTSGRLGRRKLLVSNPLQPHEKIDAFLVSSHEL